MFDRLKMVELRERRLARDVVGMVLTLVLTLGAAAGLLFGMAL